MYLNHPKVSRYHYSKYHINVQQDSRKTCSPTISNKLLKLSNTSCDFSERASITIYLPRIIYKSSNSEWLSKSKILNKQTKWEESISLAGILANANFTSWKKNKNSTMSQWKWKQSPKHESVWILLCKSQHTEERGKCQSWGEWAEVTDYL